jgi:sentrin-specific protease 1
MAAIRPDEKRIEYYDSLYRDKLYVLENLYQWLGQEHSHRKGGPLLSAEDWELVYVNDIPRQTNGYDCGVFALAFAETVSRGLSVTLNSFSQKDMPSFRNQIKYDILRLWKTKSIQ